MSESVKYPWYRVHLVTCLVAVAVAIGLTWPQLIWMGDQDNHHLMFSGWPLRFVLAANSGGRLYPMPIAAFVINMIVAIAIISGTIVFVDTTIRHFRFQFSLGSMLCWATVIAMCLGKHMVNPALGDVAVALVGANLSLLFVHVPLIPSVLIYPAVICTLFIAVSSIPGLFDWLFRRLGTSR